MVPKATVPRLGPLASLSAYRVLQIQPIARVATFAGPVERTQFYQVLQVPCCGCPCRSRNRDIVLRAEAAFEPSEAFSEHALDHLGSPVIQVIPMLVVEMCLRDEEPDPVESHLLRCQDRRRKTIPATA